MPASSTSPRSRPRRTGPRGPSKGQATLEMFVHRPANARPGSALVVVLHGCTQSARGHARDAGWLDLADREGFVVLAPGQTRDGNANLCFNWFTGEHGGANGSEVLAILSMIDQLVASDGVDPSQVFVTGLSAGGAMAFALLVHHPQVFAGGGIIAGLPAGLAGNVGQALALMRGQPLTPPKAGAAQVALAPGQGPRVSIWHGTADHIVAPVNADRLAAQWIEKAGLSSEPSRSERHGTRSRQVWTDLSGAAVLEINRLAGFGHATPLATQGPLGLGQAAPHMVECGHSSTRALAEFWGLTEPGQNTSEASDRYPEKDGRQHASGPPELAAAAPSPSLRGGIIAGLDTRIPNGIRDLIDRSLRQAGL